MQLAIFLVEDDPEQRDALIPLLSELGASSVVGVAESEDEAIQWLQKNEGQWDLVVLDLILKFGTGFGVLQRMPHHHRTRVTVLSNSASATNPITVPGIRCKRSF